MEYITKYVEDLPETITTVDDNERPSGLQDAIEAPRSFVELQKYMDKHYYADPGYEQDLPIAMDWLAIIPPDRFNYEVLRKYMVQRFRRVEDEDVYAGELSQKWDVAEKAINELLEGAKALEDERQSWSWKTALRQESIERRLNRSNEPQKPVTLDDLPF